MKIAPAAFRKCTKVLAQIEEMTRKKYEDDPENNWGSAEFDGFELDGEWIVGGMRITCNRGCHSDHRQYWFCVEDFERED